MVLPGWYINRTVTAPLRLVHRIRVSPGGAPRFRAQDSVPRPVTESTGFRSTVLTLFAFFARENHLENRSDDEERVLGFRTLLKIVSILELLPRKAGRREFLRQTNRQLFEKKEILIFVDRKKYEPKELCEGASAGGQLVGLVASKKISKRTQDELGGLVARHFTRTHKNIRSEQKKNRRKQKENRREQKNNTN